MTMARTRSDMGPRRASARMESGGQARYRRLGQREPRSRALGSCRLPFALVLLARVSINPPTINPFFFSLQVCVRQQKLVLSKTTTTNVPGNETAC